MLLIKVISIIETAGNKQSLAAKALIIPKMCIIPNKINLKNPITEQHNKITISSFVIIWHKIKVSLLINKEEVTISL